MSRHTTVPNRRGLKNFWTRTLRQQTPPIPKRTLLRALRQMQEQAGEQTS